MERCSTVLSIVQVFFFFFEGCGEAGVGGVVWDVTSGKQQEN